MTAETFRDYINKDVLPEIAATETDGYNPVKHAPVTKIKNDNDIVQKFCRKVANFHAVYDAGLKGAEAVDAQEKCKSRRKPAPSEYINPK
ncbi:unnamed protein product, partial [Ectocarpus sp. 13 AM-2016]